MKEKIKILSIVIPIIFVLDQASKHLIQAYIPIGASIPVIPDLFDIVHTRNRGAAFGFMANLPDSMRLPFFFIVSFLTLALITIYFFKLKEERKSVYFFLSLVIGGAIGNIWDRVFLGEVVDFLSFHWYDAIVHWDLAGYSISFRLEWPAFNIADSAISVAVAGMMISMLKGKKESREV